MEDLLKKISSYNLFNYLLPGAVFIFLASKLTEYDLIQEDIVIALFLYYFVGLVISRIGSVVIEPVLKKVKFLQFTDYNSFLAAEKNDPKIEILSEANNMYRTFCSLFLLLIMVRLYSGLEIQWPLLLAWRKAIGLLFLMFLFLFSYRKQTKYIFQRITIKGGN